VTPNIHALETYADALTAFRCTCYALTHHKDAAVREECRVRKIMLHLELKKYETDPQYFDAVRRVCLCPNHRANAATAGETAAGTRCDDE
jgi:hypothetical protein